MKILLFKTWTGKTIRVKDPKRQAQWKKISENGGAYAPKFIREEIEE